VYPGKNLRVGTMLLLLPQCPHVMTLQKQVVIQTTHHQTNIFKTKYVIMNSNNKKGSSPFIRSIRSNILN